MANFAGQASVNLYLAEGEVGRMVNNHPFVPTTYNRICAVPVTVATAVWRNGDDQWAYGGTGQPDGVVSNVIDYYILPYDDSIMVIPTGQRATVISRGEIWVYIATGTPTVGQSIFFNTTTGQPSAAAAGGTVAGAVETLWKVKRVATDSVVTGLGTLVAISNWDKEAPVAPADAG